MSSSPRDVDLDGYFRRVGYAGPREPSVALLGALVTAQLSAIPFENLDPVRGVPVADLGADALFAKLVHRRRGGFCFEQNGLLALVLRAAGFQVRALTGRVVWAHPAGLVGTSSTSGSADRRRPRRWGSSPTSCSTPRTAGTGSAGTAAATTWRR